MTGKTAIVWSCAHAKPEVSNERFNWLANLIYDIKPDYCIDLGDAGDFCSLNSFDTNNPQAIVSQSYEADVESYNDSQERLRHPFRYHKRKRPYWIGFKGNHEFRIDKAIAHDPRLEGQKYGISPRHLQTDHWFNEYHGYVNSAPALVDYDGVLYGHYLSANKPTVGIAGIHAAYSLISKTKCSITVGHSHKYSYHFDGGARPRPIIGHVIGCYKGEEEHWAGHANHEWRTGVVIKREIDNGVYDHTWVSMKSLRREYG